MEWDPSEFAATRGDKRVSREKYDAFCRLLGKKPGLEAELLAITSRSGRCRLRVLALDSNRVEGPEARGIGYVSREALLQGKGCIEQDPVGQFEQVFTWMAVHHHIFPATSMRLEQAQQRKASVMGNAPALLDYATRWKVEMILHGHEHQPSVTVAHRWPTDCGDNFFPITAVGAGSFSVDAQDLGPFARNHYYILYRRPTDIIIRSRWLGESGIRFGSHNDIILPRPVPSRKDTAQAT
jgi:hypothetical protein